MPGTVLWYWEHADGQDTSYPHGVQSPGEGEVKQEACKAWVRGVHGMVRPPWWEHPTRLRVQEVDTSLSITKKPRAVGLWHVAVAQQGECQEQFLIQNSKGHSLEANADGQCPACSQ